MSKMIKPRTLRGFRDALPQEELRKRQIQKKLEQIFRSFGFVPIDTPVLEYAEILLGKGGGETDKQVYRFFDHGKRDVALRFDLTVPFARFMAEHAHELPLPFRRYHMAKVWRGENTQRGRYREFIQIDFDIVGSDSPSADLEILLVMQKSMAALGIEGFRIHLFHRGIFNLFLSTLGLDLDKTETQVMRIIDKIKKIGAAKTLELLTGLTASSQAEAILNFIQAESNDTETLKKLTAMLPTNNAPLQRLATVWEGLVACGLEQFFCLDPSITRGLDYYTGIVYETFLSDLPSIGSVCSGGRYNDLASLYSKEKLPGVGSSIGLDRLLGALEELNVLGRVEESPQLILLCLDEALLATYHRLASTFREWGYCVEVYPDKKKLAAQFAYAEKRGIPLALFYGTEEHETGRYSIRDLQTRETFKDLDLMELKKKLADYPVPKV